MASLKRLLNDDEVDVQINRPNYYSEDTFGYAFHSYN
jgi:hypothetical protein